MKVIHFIASIDEFDGGTTEYMKLLSGSLKKLITLEIATCTSKKPVIIPEVPVTFFEFSIKNLFKLKNQIKKYLIDKSPDIVHINGIWSLQNAIFHFASKELNLPIILSPHGMLEPYILKRNSWKKKLALLLYQKKVLNEIKYFHATSQLELNNIKKMGFEKEFIIIPNGIDMSEVPPIKTNYGTKKMVFLSRIHPKKGIELLLEAWHNNNTTDWVLEIAGNGEPSYIETLIKSAQDLKNVRFVGPQFGKAKWDFLRSAAIMVLPTHSENFGIVVAEALAVGVPVITTTGTPWEELQTHHCGWWIELSVKNLMDCLENSMQSSPQQLSLMGNNGQQLIKEKYDINAVAQNLVELYKKILN